MKLLINALMTTALFVTTTLTMANTAVNQTAITANATTTVKHALTLADDTRVQLRGYVVRAIGDEKYQFRDSTGTITVDIDDDLWKGQAISAKTPVMIYGEVDIDYKPIKRVEIDVDSVKF